MAITNNNEIWINREQVPLESVRVTVERLRRENPRGSAVLQTDGAAHTRFMIEVLQGLANGTRE